MLIRKKVFFYFQKKHIQLLSWTRDAAIAASIQSRLSRCVSCGSGAGATSGAMTSIPGIGKVSASIVLSCTLFVWICFVSFVFVWFVEFGSVSIRYIDFVSFLFHSFSFSFNLRFLSMSFRFDALDLIRWAIFCCPEMHELEVSALVVYEALELQVEVLVVCEVGEWLDQ